MHKHSLNIAAGPFLSDMLTPSGSKVSKTQSMVKNEMAGGAAHGLRFVELCSNFDIK
jgi:hypothetical protein